MIRVGVVGNGETIGIAKMHIQAYQLMEDVEITALYDILPGRSRGYIDKLELKNARACTSYEELLENVDAVSICTPNFTHIDLVVQALKAGKHVLCEKPFGTDEVNCEKAIQYAKTAGLICVIGLCYRYIPGMLYMKKMIDEGKLGDIFYVRQSLGGNRIADPEVKLEWRMQKDLSGPGAVADFGSHMLDIGDYLIREHSGRIAEVSCMEHTFIKERQIIGEEQMGEVTNGDVAIFSARTEKGTLLSYTASRIGGNHTVEVFGSGGYLGFNGETPFQVTVLRKDPKGAYEPKKEIIDVPKELYMPDNKVPQSSFAVNFYLQNRQFIDAVKTGEKKGVGFERGMYIQKLIDALQLSADTHTTIEIDF